MDPEGASPSNDTLNNSTEISRLMEDGNDGKNPAEGNEQTSPTPEPSNETKQLPEVEVSVTF